MASILDQLASLDVESAGALTLDDGGRVVALCGKLVKLRDQFGGSLTYARRLLERAVRVVLASGAHGGVKSLYERALAHWPPTAADDGALASSSASPVRFARGDTPHCCTALALPTMPCHDAHPPYAVRLS